MKSLRDYRVEKRMSQARLAEIVGVSTNAISSYETGVRKPNPRVAEKIAAYFGMNRDEMWSALYSDRDPSHDIPVDGRETG